MSEQLKGMMLFGQPVEPNITFHVGDPMKEVMRIDRHGVKVNPECSVDEATQHVLNALTKDIQHTVNHAVAEEREACHALRQTLSNPHKGCQVSAHAYDMAIVAYGAAIRARGEK